MGKDAKHEGPVRIGAGDSGSGGAGAGSFASVWQQTVDGTPYLWCELSRTTVGAKAFFLDIAGQNLTFTPQSSGLRGTCSSGYYGQAAWTVYTLSDSSCFETCTPGGLSSVTGGGDGNEGGGEEDQEGASCTGFFDKESGQYRLESQFVDSSGAVAPACERDWTCLRNFDLAGEASDGYGAANCTVLTRQDEYCAECPAGSECADFTTRYSVEPVAVEGYWREQLREGETSASGIADFRCEVRMKIHFNVMLLSIIY